MLRVLCLGHPEMMADLVYLRAIILSSATLLPEQRRDYLRRHFDAVAALAPDFRAPYLIGGRTALYSGPEITSDDVFLSNHLLEEGARQFPSDWEIAFAIGCNYLVELKTDDPRRRAEWRLTGAHWVRRAALDGGGPPWLPGLAATVMTEEGQAEAAIRYLEEAYLNAADERTRDEVKHLLAAKRARGLAQLTSARDAVVAGWQRWFPYAPPDFFVLMGPPPSPRLDPDFILGRLLPPEPPIEEAADPASPPR